MASLKDIRRRISSVKNTQQITKAMKMVSASKLRRAQQAIAGARPYAEKLESLTGRVVGEIMESYSSLEDNKKTQMLSKLHPLLKAGNVASESSETRHKIALIVLSSDRGLCGAYNSNILRYSYRYYKELAASPGVEVSTFFLGRRGYDFFNRRGVKGHYFAEFWAGRFSVAKSNVISQYFVEKFMSGEFDKVEICFTNFKSALTQTPEVKQILPITIELGSVAAPAGAPFIYEPGRKEILGALLPNQVKTQIYRVCAESLASEFGARMTAMDNATRNASEMISGLTLQANRLRQANITKELMEIIGGAEAMKG
ncbi:MAG: ATP synthase F1 subunit gamma [Bdellovibrionales bacterium]|nr:ATP synthase F1 subunit gamma [Bdellovibrionales bacterium]